MGSILIVEDDRPFAETMAFILQLEGHSVTMATNAEDAIKLVTNQQPDLVISDWMLGGYLHGGDVCCRIREVWPTVKTIIITGYLDISPEIGRWSEYSDTIIEKPFHKEDILEAVRQAFTDTAISIQ
jgi:DNA-binding response OmpR family regulator